MFRRSLGKGYFKNAELDPAAPPALQLMTERDETFIVRIHSTKGWHYWFSDRRLLREDPGSTQELLRYEAIQQAHWMFSDLHNRWKLARSPSELTRMKLDHFDRLEIELPTGIVSLEGLDQAYETTLKFFRWVVWVKKKSNSEA